MVEVYKSIDALFYSKRPEINFDENLLDQLDENERRDIESKIVRLCINGYEDCYKYIPFLKYEDVEKKLNIETLRTFPSTAQAKAYYYLLVKTKDHKYMKELKEVCDDTILTYTWLLYSTAFNELYDKYRDELKQHLKERAPFVENDPQNLCIKIYERGLPPGSNPPSNNQNINNTTNGFRL